MNIPLVSVAMVVRNVDQFLREAIESVLAQTFTDFELLITDFGSTDRTKAIVSEYAAQDSRVRMEEIEPCSLAEARNHGCFAAIGKYIAIMDADDVALPDRLEKESYFLEQHPEIGVVGGSVEFIDAAGKSIMTVLRRHIEDHQIQSALLDSCPIWQPTVMFRRELFLRVGGYRKGFAQSEDHDLWLRMAERTHLANLADVLVRYRIHPHQVSMSGRRVQTLCSLAARLSAVERRHGRLDPLEQVSEITPEWLVAAGVSLSTQQAAVIQDYECWIRTMWRVGETDLALKVGQDVLKSVDCQLIKDSRSITDLRLTVASMLCQKKQLWKSASMAALAVATRPRTLARPLKRMAQMVVGTGKWAS